MEPAFKNYLLNVLPVSSETPTQSATCTPVGGGSINRTWRLSTAGDESWFVKTNSSRQYPGLFEKEERGLRLIREQDVIRTPVVVASGTWKDQQFLVLEWIIQGSKTEAFWEQFGHQLAGMHKVTGERFGLDEDNYMGALTQNNSWLDTWINFFVANRLQPQVALAQENQLVSRKHLQQFDRLYTKLDRLFHPEPPALLHGDLWSGNFLADDKGQPVLIDPAVYYGHRSIDLGMTTLFGGFAPRFYNAYHERFPFPDNYREQWEVCNLYPLLIHLNLFGSGYLSGIERTLERFQ